jgi:uncharacterized repeat protein (TIGR02543 family)
MEMSPDGTTQFSLSGNIGMNGTGMAGATIKYKIDGGAEQTSGTDADGNYELTAPSGSVIAITGVIKESYLAAGTAQTEFYMQDDLTGADIPLVRDPAFWAFVTFDPANGDPATGEWVLKGTSLSKPANPGKPTFKFSGWALDGKKWDFAKPVNDDMTLIAQYDHDTEFWAYYMFRAESGSALYGDWVLKGTLLWNPPGPNKEGFVFSGWYVNGTKWDFDTPVSGDMTLYAGYIQDPAVWALVKFDPNNGGPVTEQWVLKGKTPIKPADPEKLTFIFDGWYLNGTKWDLGTPVDDDMTLCAQYVHDTSFWAVVTFDPNNGKAKTERWVEKGKTMFRPADPINDTYLFVGWYLDGVKWDFATPVNNDMTLVADYIHYYMFWALVTFEPNNGGPATEQWVRKGKPMPVPADPEKPTFIFDGWYLNGTKWNFEAPVNNDMTLTAGYVEDVSQWFFVTFDPKNGEPVTKLWVGIGTIIAKPANPGKLSFIFDGWYLNGTKWNFGAPVDGDIVLEAQYDYDTVFWAFVVFFQDNGTSVTMQWIEKGGLLQRPDDPKKHAFKFDRWCVNGKKWDFTAPVHGSMFLVAEYDYDSTYWAFVTFDPANGSPVTGMWVEKGTVLFKPDDPSKQKFTFGAWCVNGKPWDFGAPVSGDMTIVAQYSYDPLYWTLITVASNEGGSFEYRLDGIGGFIPFAGTLAVEKGTFVEIRAVPGHGYSFVWDDDRASDNAISFIAAEDEELTGTFLSSAAPGGSAGYGLWILAILFLILSLIFLITWNRESE